MSEPEVVPSAADNEAAERVIEEFKIRQSPFYEMKSIVALAIATARQDDWHETEGLRVDLQKEIDAHNATIREWELALGEVAYYRQQAEELRAQVKTLREALELAVDVFNEMDDCAWAEDSEWQPSSYEEPAESCRAALAATEPKELSNE